MSNKFNTDYYDCLERKDNMRQPLTIFIPTKDRPMQFEACLNSITTNLFVNEKCPIYVLAKSSNEHIKQCYEQIYCEYLNKYHLDIVLHHEQDFRTSFLSDLSFIKDNYLYILGMTDDTIFYRPYIFPLRNLVCNLHDSTIFTISLRLGANTTIQNPDNPSEKIVIPSQFYTEPFGPKVAYWCWNNPKLSINCRYPISLDGHIYRSSDLYELSNQIPFNNLREWEAELMHYVFHDKENLSGPAMCCFESSYTVNISCNLTQHPFIEKMGPYGKSLVELQKLYDEGYRVNLSETFKNVEIVGSHQYIELQFHKG